MCNKQLNRSLNRVANASVYSLLVSLGKRAVNINRLRSIRLISIVYFFQKVTVHLIFLFYFVGSLILAFTNNQIRTTKAKLKPRSFFSNLAQPCGTRNQITNNQLAPSLRISYKGGRVMHHVALISFQSSQTCFFVNTTEASQNRRH